MATKKPLNMIQLTRGMQIVDTLEKADSQLELLAVYLAPVSVLIKARTDPKAMDDVIAQAAELSAEEGGELLADFMTQFGKYAGSLASCGLALKGALPELSSASPEIQTT